jgi:multiple sugar transport system ATP-binding protein
MMNGAVSLRGIDIAYEGNRVLQGLDLEIAPGEFVVLLGPSGCGKSTLLGAIAGLVEITGGTLCLHGEEAAGTPPKDRGIGMVFQSYALYPTMSVRDNLSFGLRCAKRPGPEIEQRVAQVAEMLRLTPLLDRKPAGLSGGQRQRVAIGRALARQARILLCDEPLSNLDAKLRADLRREFKQLHRTLGNTIVYVTHDQVEAMTLADRIAVMNDGVIEQFGTPAEVYETPASRFVALFVGMPSANMIEGMLECNGAGARFTAEGITLNMTGYAFSSAPPPSGGVSLAIRPEHLALTVSGDPCTVVTGEVDMIERMGADSYVTIRSGSHLLQVRINDGRLAPTIGESVGLSVETGRISLFSKDDGRRL